MSSVPELKTRMRAKLKSHARISCLHSGNNDLVEIA